MLNKIACACTYKQRKYSPESSWGTKLHTAKDGLLIFIWMMHRALCGCVFVHLKK